MAKFGDAVPADLNDLHPLRRVEKPPPTAEEQKAESDAGFTLLARGLAHLNRERGR